MQYNLQMNLDIQKSHNEEIRREEGGSEHGSHIIGKQLHVLYGLLLGRDWGYEAI